MIPNENEFLEILANYQGILYKVSLIYFRNETDRQDNFQEIVYQLWKSFPSLKNKESVGSWIYAVSINTSITNLRKKSKIEYRDRLPDIKDTGDYLEKISGNQNLQLLIRAVQDLNEIDKSIIFLYLEDKSYEEIANIMGISVTNVGTKLNRIKDKLKNNFKSENDGNK
jgi:RNA polymerase sigma-70 factor, ECF subfamily